MRIDRCRGKSNNLLRCLEVKTVLCAMSASPLSEEANQPQSYLEIEVD